MFVSMLLYEEVVHSVYLLLEARFNRCLLFDIFPLISIFQTVPCFEECL